MPAPAPLLIDAAKLSHYAVVFRYLDAPHEPDEAEALHALGVAQRLHAAVTGIVAQR